MEKNEISLGLIGFAAMAYVLHITNHPSLCEFFLKVGIIGMILSVIEGIYEFIVDCKKQYTEGAGTIGFKDY